MFERVSLLSKYKISFPRRLFWFLTMNDFRGSGRELIILTDQYYGPQGKHLDSVAPPSGSTIEMGLAVPDDLRNLLDHYRAKVHAMFAARAAHASSILGPPGALSADERDHAHVAKNYFSRVIAPDADLDKLAKALRTIPGIHASYVKPAAELAINTMASTGPPPEPGPTQDFSGHQTYLNNGPDGIGARHAWTMQGGKGAGVTIIDVEGAWCSSHECLQNNNLGLLFGYPSVRPFWRNHGSAVLGLINAADDGRGIVGIAPDARVGTVSIFDGNAEPATAEAIRQAARQLGPGDIMLIELHRSGPLHDFKPRNDQQGYIAVEWWPDDYEQIQQAVEKGIIVVQAAGNGGVSLDGSLYDKPGEGFLPDWINPFKRRARDSGAILVGAGAPPNTTRDASPNLSRLDFSNYGNAVDVQGWGSDVATCGYGDLQGGPNENAWYTKCFSGTSSAAPMVVGVLACLQGYLRAAGLPLLTPRSARDLLRSSGHPQSDAPGRPAAQRIGARPDLQELIAMFEAQQPTV